MTMWRKAMVASAVAGVLAGCGGSDDDGKPMDLTILHINDHHSTLESKSKTLQLSAGGAAPQAVTVDAGGFPRVTAAIAELAAQSPNVLKLHAGDALTGTLYFNRAGADGEADAAMMNTVCFDAFTLGNHEFDKGDSGLKGFIDRLHAGSCKTPVLSANVRFGANSALNASRAPGLVNASTVVERGGQKIGIVGLTIAGKTKASSSPDADTTFEDEAVAAQREIDRLRAQGIDKIIVMSHIGYQYDQQVIAKLSGVDVVVGGDSHTLLGPDPLGTTGVGTPGGAYPTRLADKDGKNVCLVQAWEYAQVVGELKVSFDAKGEVTACNGTPHVLIGDNYKLGSADATAAQRTAIAASVAATGFLRVTAPQAAATAVLQPFKDKVAVFNQTRVAVAPQELCSRRVPGGPGSPDYSRSSAACTAEGSVGVRGGDIQQLVAQAYLEVANRNYGGADITLQSGGGVRVPLLDTVTAAQAIQVLPFGNMLFRLDVTGQEVKGMLEDGLEAVYGTGGSTGPYPYTGGMRFDVNATAAFGNRVTGIEVRDQATGNWVALDVGKSYRLFVLSFNATGGDGYKTLAAVPAARRLDIGVLDADVFFSYIEGLPKDTATGLPVLARLPHGLYSTKSFTGPN
ncbi:bifunctional UDP-sugar hydrolase/5'-nucleotidase [Pseudorhodoferax sp. Leaf274]|uniref:bifunctional metallophosphatase/5'-nucleotidase n=1 Tax=Pseudorhodoferax sp. Leaf274 TaxID=1736318 RepID=UPI0007032088|nr:5'-nucleotidase C-terminal domain-containing protein [Pseudorhodoferax sp. Leaf274]KQP36170.1 metallophosphatase [Pseudorhodoferax sp. Leaf274]